MLFRSKIGYSIPNKIPKPINIKDGNLIFEGKLDNLYQITNENNIENAFIKISGGEI